MKQFLTIIILCGFALFGYSQTSSKSDNIKTLLELTGSGKLGVQAMQSMLISFKKSHPSVPEEFWNDFMSQVNPDALISLIIPIYDKYYTDAEVLDLIRFYKTPLGQKVITTMPQVMQESMEAGKAWGKAIGEKAYNNLKEKGFIETE